MLLPGDLIFLGTALEHFLRFIMAIPVENFFLDNTTQGTLQTRVQQMIASGILSGRFERGKNFLQPENWQLT